MNIRRTTVASCPLVVVGFVAAFGGSCAGTSNDEREKQGRGDNAAVGDRDSGDGDTLDRGDADSVGFGDDEATDEGDGDSTEVGDGDSSGDHDGDSDGDGPGDNDTTDEDMSNWTCAEEFIADGECDCGCGAHDPDCGTGGCTDPGCNVSPCLNCFDIEGQAHLCLPQDWQCSPSIYADGYTCDCGCGVPDPDCYGGFGGCSEPGCVDDMCEMCYLAPGVRFNCDNPPPEGWTCRALDYGDGHTCHCGCGVKDVDCSVGCAAPGCTPPAECDICHELDGDAYHCTTPPPQGWSCLPIDYGDSTCDCGCTVSDMDCGSDGCVAPDCYVSTCQFCHTTSGELVTCQE